MFLDDLLELKEMQSSELLTGESKEYLHITNVYIAATRDFIRYIKMGDFILFNGVGGYVDDASMHQMIEGLIRKRASGLLIVYGPYIHNISSSNIEYAKMHKFPIVAMDLNGELSEIATKIMFLIYKNKKQIDSSNRYMRELLYGDEKKALVHLCEDNYVRTRQHMVIYLGFDQEGYTKDMIIEMAEAVPVNLAPRLFSVYYPDDDGVIVVLELSQREEIKHIVTRIMSSVQNELDFPNNNVSAGVSSVFYEPERMKACIDEAKKAFQVLRGCKVHHQARYFEEIGIYRFFFELNNDAELQDFVMQYLGELIQYDKDNGTDFVYTLQVYLEENCNIGITSESMYLHRNTVKYRIERIQEILNVDLANVNTCFNLRLAFKVRKYFGGKF